MLKLKNQALKELLRVRRSPAFNIRGAASRKRLNQYAVRYTFNDGSILLIFPRTSRATAKSATGEATTYPLSINT